MKNFGILFNPNYQEKERIFKLLQDLHRSKNLEFFKIPEQSEFLPKFIKTIDNMEKSKIDCILTFGGDGTFLRAINFSLKANAPLLGINLGQLGFLSESNLKELEKSIDDLKNNKFKIQERMLLRVQIKRDGKQVFLASALNDAVIHRGQAPKLIDIYISSNRRFVVETRCDGIIASTPTGSTAYNLSAGGPIISPLMEAIVLTPLNPHVLTVRPMVFSAADTIRFMIKQTQSECLLQMDGRNSYNLRNQDEVIVSSSPQKVKFIKLSNKTFFQILRKKFHLGQK
ncbi:MAG: NAD(+)/NADH kinase [Candidatus Cloacimonetes bacterium]|nr:NAD(+)/NADH kinase [Candidatus Cloacimonadota bacterium]